MACPRDHKKHLALAAEDLLRSLARFIDAAGDVPRSAGNGAGRPSSTGNAERRRGPGKGNPKLKSKLKAYWANLTPEQRKARIAKMHAWRKE